MMLATNSGCVLASSENRSSSSFHLLVILLAGTLQQRLVSRILNQRMLEEVARPRRAAALIEQLVDQSRNGA
jgi:hypothetical protein